MNAWAGLARHAARGRLVRLALTGAMGLGALGGCTTASYYWQSFNGHMAMMGSARPIDDWLSDTATPEKLKARLKLAQQIRRFAVDSLKLPENSSYHRYADLRRSAAVWNLTAAPEFSLTVKNWCFPVAGCVGYKGYFDEAEARQEAARLQAEGLEVSVYPVPAYSTLGWMNWAGGDPLLNTFISYPEGELARLIFHELAHQVAYAPGDTAFNESFATAVERLGGARWLAEQASAASQAEYETYNNRRKQFRALTLALRRELEAVYRDPPALSDGQARLLRAQAKEAAMRRFHERYALLRQQWGGYAGYDAWVARTNNASLGALAAYDELVPAFEALFAERGSDWASFYDAVRRLAAMPPTERQQALRLYTQAQKDLHG
ncbi:MAG: aminopeptidase [Pseudomonadota bacterium]